MIVYHAYPGASARVVPSPADLASKTSGSLRVVGAATPNEARLWSAEIAAFEDRGGEVRWIP